MSELLAPRMALTVDLEDWHHGLQIAGQKPCLEEHTARLLSCIDGAGVKATFFVLGSVAAAYPALIRRIANEGHEIGFHGAEHDFLRQVGKRRFASELSYWRPRLQDLTGQPIGGYRAPFFSLTPQTQWALDCLLDAGFEYDASLYPGYNDRYGWPGAPSHPVSWRDSPLVVFPVPLIPWLKVGYSGGAYLRMLPFAVVKGALWQRRKSGRPGMVYAHPFEAAAVLPWRWGASWRANLTRHLCRGRFQARLKWLLAACRTELAPMNEVIARLSPLTPWSPERLAHG